MEKIIKDATEKLKNGTITKDEADKILLDLFSVMPSLPTEKEFKNEAEKNASNYKWAEGNYKDGIEHGFLNGCYYCTNFKRQ